jgi:putative selenium metabolism hydrolase
MSGVNNLVKGSFGQMISALQFDEAIASRRDSLIEFTSSIVSTPSLSGEEGDVAAKIIAELKRLAFDDVWTDDVGNIIAKVNGGDARTVMLNGHMDVVDPGPESGWPYAAYSGKVVDGELWGRGSVDMKGPVAAMIYGAASFKQIGDKPPGDILMTVAVMEEIGGLGSQFMMEKFREDGLNVDVAIVGEPSSNQLRLGHRGRIEIQVKFSGRSAHASAPHLGINPHFGAAKFLDMLEQLPLAKDGVLGSATIAPTLYLTDQVSANVIPSEATVFLDWRNVPQESPEHAVAALETLLSEIQFEGESEVRVTSQDRKTWPGIVRHFASIFPPFSTDPNCKLAQVASGVIAESTGKDASPDVWKFATDGGHISLAGIPVVGFGPGDDRLAHTNQERISIEQLQQASSTYGSLIAALATAET